MEANNASIPLWTFELVLELVLERFAEGGRGLVKRGEN